MNLDNMIPDNMQALEQPDIPWSPLQNAIFTAIHDTSDNLSIEAVAGSGKTTTILEGMRRTGSSNVLFLAFNKSIQMELASRVPYGVTASTFNALGHQIWSRKATTRRVDSYKMLNILREILTPDSAREYGWDLSKLLSSAKHSCVGIRTELSQQMWETYVLNSSYFFPSDKISLLASACKVAFDLGIDRGAEVFDFDDQLYLPLFHNMTFPAYDVVFVDEAQDLSPIQHEMLRALADRGARIIAVGDSHQAIYAFRGADSESMDRLARTFKATKLPLSVCYRCDARIVNKAKTLVPHIQHRENAPDGYITHHDEYPHPDEYPEKCMIICRNNAPLMSLALKFLEAEVPCYVVMDFARDLTKLIDKMQASTGVQLAQKLRAWADKEIAELTKAGRDHLISYVEDRLNCILPFCEKYQYVAQIKSTIIKLTESSTGPRLSTVHKAKGLEADEVFILRPDLMPSHFATKALDLYDDHAPMQQEENLMYVAWTRAIHHLHILPDEGS